MWCSIVVVFGDGIYICFDMFEPVVKEWKFLLYTSDAADEMD